MKVSVVVPNYNYAHYLPECLDSMLTQTFSDWEVIVVDDTSTDGSCDIVERYVDRYPGKFNLIRLSGGPSGTPRAINAGVREMRGEYFSWLSSDDRSTPAKIEKLVKALEANPNAGMVHTAYRFIDENGIPTGEVTTPRDYPGTDAFYRLLEGNIINGSTVLVRKHLLDSAGPLIESDEHLPDLWRVAEYVWWLEIALRADVALVTEPLHDFRIHSANRAYNTSSFGPELVKLVLRTFLLKYGFPALVDTIAGRSHAERAEVYRHITFALAQELLPADLTLFANAIRCEGGDEYKAITESARTAQAVHAIGSLDDYGVRSERLVLTLLNRAKENYAAGRFEAAAAQLQNLLKVSKRFPDLDLSARYYLALALEQSHDVAGAETLFSSVLASAPKHAKAMEGLARIRNGKNITRNQLAYCS